jgi:hypothetical protein
MRFLDFQGVDRLRDIMSLEKTRCSLRGWRLEKCVLRWRLAFRQRAGPPIQMGKKSEFA